MGSSPSHEATPEISSTPRFHIGQDRRGQWVVRDQRGLCGGLFVSSAEAVRYAMFESSGESQSLVIVSEILEFDMMRNDKSVEPPALARAA